MTQLMQEEITNFIQSNSPDGGFLQSEEWRKFQEYFGRKTFNVSFPSPPTPLPRGEGELFFWANIIEHELPIVGKYFYIPRGPVFCHPERSPAFGGINSAEPKDLIGFPAYRPASPNRGEQAGSTTLGMTELINLAKKNNVGWIRFDANYPPQGSTLGGLKVEPWEIRKAPHDMQPGEIFMIDITKSEKDLLAEMKSKTRYNIKLAQKHGVTIPVTRNPEPVTQKIYIEKFIELVKITAKRDGITPHPDEYYRKMFETIPAENIKLYIAEYDGPASTRGDSSSTRGGKVIAANIIVFYGRVATYLHGASDNEYRNVMAPYLLQWQAMLDAKAAGCERYDLGGVKIPHPLTPSPSGRGRLEESGEGKSSWTGITKFKTGFSVTTEPITFPGSYDIIINPFKYNLYKTLQAIRALF